MITRGDRGALPALYEFVRGESVDARRLNPAAIRALWTSPGLGAPDGNAAAATEVAVAALKHPSGGVRRNAVQVLPRAPASLAAILAAKLTADPDPQARLSDAGIAAATKNADAMLAALGSAEKPSPAFLTAVGVVAEHYARRADTVGAVVRGLVEGWPAKALPKVDAAFDAALVRAAERLPAARRGALVRLATTWQSRTLAKLGAETAAALLAKVKDALAGAAERSGAAAELLGYRPADPATVGAILAEVTPQASPDLAAGLVRSLRAAEAPRTPDLILSRLPSFTPDTRSAALAVLLARPEGTAKLLAALDKGAVQVSDFALDQKQALAEHPDRATRAAALAVLKRGGALPSADRQKVIDGYAAAATTKGDALASKKAFTEQSAKCHKHGGEGAEIGPDLTGMAEHPREELLVHILDPNRSAEGNFRVYQVSREDGRVVRGMLAAESKTAVEILDAEGKRHSILRSDTESLVGTLESPE